MPFCFHHVTVCKREYPTTLIAKANRFVRPSPIISRVNVFAATAVLLSALAASCPAQLPPMRVHDPRIIKAGDWFYLFSTGIGITVWRSHDLATWERDGVVFDQALPWTANDFPRGNYYWAPDITYFGGKYHLYYAVSHFGINDSAIGHATNATLDRSDNRFAWADQGSIVRTRTTDDWNAIDPSVFVDGKTPWLVAGSFWSGIKLLRLDPRTGALADTQRIALARRHAPDALEAGCITHHGEFYYLLVSFDYCCRGVRSTYKLMVGRSRDIAGPYVDFDGRPMMEGGGTLVLAGYGHVRGPGHAGVFNDGQRDLLVHHFYDADEDGRSKVQVRPLIWPADGWPLAGEPLAASPSASTQPARIAGHWMYSIDFTEPFAVELLDDSSTKPDVGRWSVKDGAIIFAASPPRRSTRLPLTCFLSADQTCFIGRNSEGAIIRGVRGP